MLPETIQKIVKNYEQLELSLVNQLFIESPDHPPTTGSYREDVWLALFRQIIPYKFSIVKGAFIIDSNRKTSKEIDLVVFDEQYTPYIFNYGNIRFIPIEAVAIVIQCKSQSINNRNLRGWKKSINALATDTRSVTRIFNGVVSGKLEPEKGTIEEKDKKTQTGTRPISILCHLTSSIKPDPKLFDFIICANKKSDKLEINIPSDQDLGTWYKSLNHNDKRLKNYIKEYNNTDKLGSYEVKSNAILSLIFQLNQLLMLINNPMLFPHKAYVDMFNPSKK